MRLRDPIATISQSSKFRCGADIVWGVITDPDTYKDWYGWPEHASLISLNRDIRMGTRLLFRNFTSSKIVTEYEEGVHLAFSDEMVEESFTITEDSVGCELTIQIDLYSTRSPIADKLDANALEMLRGIKEISYAREAVRATQVRKVTPGDSKFRKFVMEDPEFPGDEGADSLPDLTPRRAVLGIVMTVILMLVLVFTEGIPYSHIIPSSGRSVYYSDKITPDQIQNIRFDWTRDMLETELDCVGYDTGIRRQYVYYSSELDNDSRPVGILYVTYDAYDVVRRYAYVDTIRSRQGLSTGIRSLDGLSGRMTVSDVTSYMTEAPSGYVVNRSGAKTVFYGILNANDHSVFSSSLHAELNIKLNSSSGTKSYAYYWRNGSDNPLYDMPRTARGQETTASEYLNDRYAYENVFLLIDKKPVECTILLGSGISTAEDERIYRVRNPQGTEDYYRYEYNIYFSQGRASTVVFTNIKLASNTHDVLNEVALDHLYDAKDLKDVESILGILPSRVACDLDRCILFYGTVQDDGRYPLEIEISRSFLKVSSITINSQEPIETETAEAENS